MLEPDEKTPSGWQLSPLQIPTLRSPIVVPLGGLSVGRDPSNALSLPTDHFPGVSGHHAHFFFDGDELWVEDLGSKNGTIVLGERIEKRKLNNGDVLQFGSGGPRFAVLSAAGLEGTVSLARTAFFGARPKSSIGEETVERVRAQLDLPDKLEVAQMIAGGERKNRTRLTLGLLLLVSLGGGAGYWLHLKSSEEQAANRASLAELQEEQRSMKERLLSSRSQLEKHQGILETRQREFEDARASWDSDRSSLMEERERLVGRIETLANKKETTNVDLDVLRQQLEETTRHLSLYDPVNLEQARLREVARINRAVVMVEAKEVLKERTTGEVLYISEDEYGFADFNFDGEGEPLAKEASGSGFCLSDDGYILTNAHVVFKEEHDDQSFLDLADEMDFEAELQLTVTFSGNSTKHSAVLVSYIRTQDNDLALLMVEDAFEGIPTVGKLSLLTPEPIGGTEVFCIGFPLGRTVMQQGETVIASTFRGIVSRKVQGYLQVDAAIHPGASGGPVIDGTGNVVGVVTAIHPVDREGKASAIGYIIPIAAAEVLWPFD
ncbi:MAG: trypsin-like peptidase domain-containing protein [Planctomycetes bacterium]|nr:trypsin-like peptidase domain-containing protein [Planctomycetota bacterium]